MLNELKIFFNNIKNFRHLITEGVSDNDIVDAIQNHEYIYIYYAGDDTIERGYRTIRPFVLGTSTTGNKVLRAWQDRGKSDSLRADSPRKRQNHEYTVDNDGKSKPGWRLFLVDKITSSYPTGKKFVDKDGKVLIPPLYNPDDKQMTSIVAAVTPKTSEKIQTKGLDSIEEPDKVAQKVSAFDAQTSKWKRFYDASKSKREANARDVQKLYDIAKRVMKKSPNNYVVAINNKNEYELVDIRNRDKIPPEALVGNLTNLYDKIVRQSKTTQPEQDQFVKQQRDSVLKEIQKNPVKRKSFFK